jgi:DNA adenine methylase/adenine-specific DNA-methyltransferase
MRQAEYIFNDPVMEKLNAYPLMRYMGSKHKLISWIYDIVKQYDFDTVLDGFSGSGVVSYLFKCMNKEVYSNDFLHFSSLITKALVENQGETMSVNDINKLIDGKVKAKNFIANTFKDVFYSEDELKFLDKVSANMLNLKSKHKRALAYTALFRACIKKQPRGVFTVSGNLSHYDDGRRDLRLSLKEHFLEQLKLYNTLVFDNGRENSTFNQNIFDFNNTLYKPDLVYLDPPYVPKSDDNCYIKRYHFLEGLSKYWEGEEIMQETKVKKIQKKYTPFSYRKTSLEAFDMMFKKFSKSIIVLSYSSNAYPDLEVLMKILKKHKKLVNAYEKPHRYHFGNHSTVNRAEVNEYLIVGV